jgi:hypothetical protein
MRVGAITIIAFMDSSRRSMTVPLATARMGAFKVSIVLKGFWDKMDESGSQHDTCSERDTNGEESL